jgi:hypothetical protein
VKGLYGRIDVAEAERGKAFCQTDIELFAAVVEAMSNSAVGREKREVFSTLSCREKLWKRTMLSS